MTTFRICLAVAVGLAATVMPVFAGNTAQQSDIKRGQVLLTRDCSRCHAVRATGDSPHAGAPAFRTLATRYPIESLEEALGEGIMSGHPDMPEFHYDADDVGAIIVYLKSIRKR